MNMIFLLLTNPLLLSGGLIIQSILISIIIFLQKSNAWFAYILLMVFLSGMMIIFTYISALSEQEKTPLKTKITLMLLITLLGLNSILFFLFKFNMFNMFNINYSISYDTYFETYKSYFMTNSHMTIFMILYLFITLIATVKIMNYSQGPLQMKSKEM